MKKAHFIGIGGIGASALARAFLHAGWMVSGSDAADSSLCEALRKEGIDVCIGHNEENIPHDVSMVVHSLAIRSDNRELVAARARGMRVASYPEALGEFAKGFYSVAVAGAHGKSTTTAMLAAICVEAGLDPTVLVGAKVPLFGNANIRFGNSQLFIFEADEYGKAFFNYYPDIAVVLNIDNEHLDIYADIDDAAAAFAQFVSHVDAGGHLVYNAEDARVSLLKKGMRCGTVPFHAPRKPWKVSVPGYHNQLNAEAAWQAAKLLGVKRKVAERALARYGGIWRRAERLRVDSRSVLRNTPVYSDYAHHPAEVRATLAALKEAHPRKKLLVVFQPHQAERLTKLFDDFCRSFNDAEEVWLLSVYEVRGREYAGIKKTSGDLAAAISRAHCFDSPDKAFRHLERLPHPGEYCIVFMGAGDIDAHARAYFSIDG